LGTAGYQQEGTRTSCTSSGRKLGIGSFFSFGFLKKENKAEVGKSMESCEVGLVVGITQNVCKE